MKSVVEYYWLEETTDENGNIESVEKIQEPFLPDSKSVEVCVKQDVWEGDGSDFGYAYLDAKSVTLQLILIMGARFPQGFTNKLKN